METYCCTPLLFSSVAWHAPRPPATPATKPCCAYLVVPRPGARRRHENRKSKKKNLPPKRQDSQVSLESPAAFSRPPPTSSTGLWQTRSERKPWNQRRKPREAYHQRGSEYEPEQQLASSCHVAATSQCMPVRACCSRRQLTIRAALAQLENIFVPPPEAHSWAHDNPQHSSAQPCKRSGCQNYMPSKTNLCEPTLEIPTFYSRRLTTSITLHWK